MATETLNNPFSGLGKIVTGDRFVGRQNELNTIKQRVLGKEYSNIAVIGLPKIGKSSLVWECLMKNRDAFITDKTIVIYYQIGSTRSSFEFFKKLATKTDDEFCEYYREEDKYVRFAQPIVTKIKEATSIEDLTDYTEQYFKKIRKWGYKIIAILDEFDHAQDIFELADFQELREISYEPETKICLVTCSRKTLSEIENKTKDGKLSNFARIFSDCPLQMFTQQDVTEYWNRVEPIFHTNDEHKKLVHFLVGSHPWLMDIVNDYYFSHQNDKLKEDEKLRSVKLVLMQSLDDMVSTLEKEKLLDAAIQLVIGPYYDVTSIQIEKLLSYGFIKCVPIEQKDRLFSGNRIGATLGDSGYVCFSDYSTLDFYRRYYADIPYVKVWSETENELRQLIKIYLAERYSSNWENEMYIFLTHNLPYRTFNVSIWSQNVQRLKTNMNDMIATFPTMRGQHIIDFTLTSQIFDVFIKCDWGWFGNVFQGAKMDWHSKFDYLTKVRNPVAHNNPGNIKAEMEQARLYCSEINQCIINWRKNRLNNNQITSHS